MNYNLGYVLNRLGAVQGALSCEPDITPDLSCLAIDELPVVLLALMNLGLRSFEELAGYLTSHGAALDLEDLVAVLEQLQSTARYADGTYVGLWRGDIGTGFVPNVSVTS
jgi:hypothetical protein